MPESGPLLCSHPEDHTPSPDLKWQPLRFRDQFNNKKNWSIPIRTNIGVKYRNKLYVGSGEERENGEEVDTEAAKAVMASV